MSETPVPDAAVQIAAKALDYPAALIKTLPETPKVLAALAAAGRLCDPAEVAALRAVADAAQRYRAMLDDPFGGSAIPEFDTLFAALDALPTTGGAR